MEAVKLKLYQNMVNYRKEMSFGYVQTYPLPTPSMIRGMVHSLLNLNEYKSLKISIQGDYKTIITNMQKIIKFDRVRDEPKKGKIDSRPRIIVNTSKASINTGVMFVDSIVDIELIIHILFDDSFFNQALLEQVYKQLLILGRNEDIIRVDEAKIVKIENVELESNFKLKNSIYLNNDLCNKSQLTGTAYRLPFYYETVTSFDDKRIFKFVDVMYIAKDAEIKEEVVDELLIDNEGDIVCFLGV